LIKWYVGKALGQLMEQSILDTNAGKQLF